MSISDQDWDLFMEAWIYLKAEKKLRQRALAAAESHPELVLSSADNEHVHARRKWAQIRDTTSDAKAHAVAAAFLGNNMIHVYAKPLNRWAGGGLNSLGKGTYRDYPDIHVGFFPQESSWNISSSTH